MSEVPQHPWGLELHRLTRGDSVRLVLESAFGSCSRGRAWVSAFMWALRDVTDHSQRQIVAHWFRTFAKVEHYGNGWRVRGAAGFVGHQHRDVDELERVELIDELTGEFYDDERPTGRMRRAHMPAFRGGSAGALAAHSRRSPRQLYRYRHALKSKGLMGSKQWKYTAPGAVLPKRRPTHTPSTWAYAHHWVHEPSAAMLKRWGFSAPAARPELGSPELPRIPSDPEQLRDLLDVLRDHENDH